MKKKIIVASVFTVALIGGIIGIKSVSGGHHTSGAETKIVQKTTIQETTTAVHTRRGWRSWCQQRWRRILGMRGRPWAG